MTPFLIVADLRTGSTLLSSSLNRRPRVRCYGELFHPQDFPDNQLSNGDRHEASGREVIRRVLDVDGVERVGFRAMVFLPLPSQPQWTDAWAYLRELDGLRVIYLTRRDRLAQYASIQVAQRTGKYHPAPGHPVLRPENRPTITVDPEAFRCWVSERDRLFARRRRQLRGKPSLELEYEALADDWSGTTRRVQEFLGIDPVPLEQDRKKQERRPLSEVITNYGEVLSCGLRRGPNER